ncbi:MAG: OPT/YSL family transporter [Syntrophothermus sp.]
MRSLAIVLGLLLTGLFAITETYLGFTRQQGFIAALPAAFLAAALLKGLPGRPGNGDAGLNANLVQSMASTAFSVAMAATVFLPAMWTWGWKPSVPVLFTFLLGGAALGFWAVIVTFQPSVSPSKRLAIFPEARAVSVLLSSVPREIGERWRSAVLLVVGLTCRVFQQGLGWWSSAAHLSLPVVAGTPWKLQMGVQVSPTLLGFGYLAGPQITRQMLAGSFFAWLGLPLIAGYFAGRDAILFPSSLPVAGLSIPQVWNNFGQYLGIGVLAGALAMRAAGELPKVFSRALAGMGFSRPPAASPDHPTALSDRPAALPIDSPASQPAGEPVPAPDRAPSLLFPGLTIIIIGLLSLNLLAGLPSPGYIGVLAGLATAIPMIWVSVRGSGFMGLSALPHITLAGAGLILAAILGHGEAGTDRGAYLVLLSAAFLATLAAMVGGDFVQNLHIWRLLNPLTGREPRKQEPRKQAAPEGRKMSWQNLPWLITAKFSSIIVAALLVSAAAEAFARNSMLGSVQFPAPQAAQFSLILKGIVEGGFPWALLLSGFLAGIGAHLLTGNGLLFALGALIPLEASFALSLGGILRWVSDVNARSKPNLASIRQSYFRQVLTLGAPGNSLAAALATGDTLAGALLAFAAYFGIAGAIGTNGIGQGPGAGMTGKGFRIGFVSLTCEVAAWVALLLVAGAFGYFILRGSRGGSKPAETAGTLKAPEPEETSKDQ